MGSLSALDMGLCVGGPAGTHYSWVNGTSWTANEQMEIGWLQRIPQDYGKQ